MPAKKTARKKVKRTSRARAEASAAHETKPKAVREGSKTAIVLKLLSSEGGCTTADVLQATGWPSVSMPQMAKACGVELRKEKAKGEPTRYYAVAA